MESVFNDSEKRFILAEMIKLSQLDVDVLVDFVKAHGIQPDWMHMQIPGGRNMSQCVRAAEIMFNMPMPPPMISPLKRKSLDDLPEYAAKRQALASPGEVSPRGFPLGATVQPALGAPPVNIQPRPNGYATSASAPSVSATSYHPNPTRRRGRPPKSAQSAQSTWHVSTYQPIAPSTAPTQPHSPGMQTHSPHQPSAPGLPDPAAKRKALPEIAPRPSHGLPAAESITKSPALPGADYPSWREETARRDYYQVHAAEHTARDRPQSTYAPILPRPRSPLQPREIARPESAEPRRYAATPPAGASEPARKEDKPAAAEPNKT